MKLDRDRILNNIQIKNDCWEWQGAKNKFGYGRLIVGSRKDGSRKTMTAHRYSYLCYNGEIGDKWVLHKCDNPKCVNPTHLYLGDRMQNVKDREDRKRNKTPNLKHEYHPNAKLNWGIINKLRKDYEIQKIKICTLSIIYEINRRTISDIVRYKTWIPEPPKFEEKIK